MSGRGSASATRVDLAEAFLREAVYRSRAAQAAASAFPATDYAAGRCGLGERASVVLDLGHAGRALFERIWSADPGAAELERVREVMRAWVVRQDALDRKRNHFLKAFRTTHGFDRTRYTREQVDEYEAGLARVNAEEDRDRRMAALELIGASS